MDVLQGDAWKAKRVLGWQYSRTFDELAREMVEHELKT
jgi:GDP-D-mannose dehydratase